MSELANALIRWHGEHGRHDLPWQQDRTAYRVWVSEIMLQQTQVATVVDYYQRFMRRFPSVASLAAASLDEVLHLWSGLGYYSRARNLHAAAQRLVRDHGGELPTQPEALARLPGIGRSTAAAILALAHGHREAILDGNVKRVLARYFGIEGAPDDRATLQVLWQRAEQCTPANEVGVYTQAIMDLGATLCKRRRPECERCPLQASCVAYRTQRVEQLPTPRVRAARPTRTVVMLLASRADGEVLLHRRPRKGVWGGLWTPPEFDNLESAARYCSASLRGAQLESAPLPVLRHGFTHFELRITPVRARCEGAETELEAQDTLWYNPRLPARIGLPAPIAALLSAGSLAP